MFWINGGQHEIDVLLLGHGEPFMEKDFWGLWVGFFFNLSLSLF